MTKSLSQWESHKKQKKPEEKNIDLLFYKNLQLYLWSKKKKKKNMIQVALSKITKSIFNS